MKVNRRRRQAPRQTTPSLDGIGGRAAAVFPHRGRIYPFGSVGLRPKEGVGGSNPSGGTKRSGTANAGRGTGRPAFAVCALSSARSRSGCGRLLKDLWPGRRRADRTRLTGIAKPSRSSRSGFAGVPRSRQATAPRFTPGAHPAIITGTSGAAFTIS